MHELLAIIQNPRLLAAFLAAVATVIVVILITVIVRSGSAAQKAVYVVDEGDTASVYILHDKDEDPTPLFGGLTRVIRLERSPDGDETIVLGETAESVVLIRVRDDEDASAISIEVPGVPQDFVWSPGGDGFAISSVGEDGTHSIYISKDDGAFRPLLSSSVSSPSLGGWSPDMDWFVYALDGDLDTRGVYIKNPDGVNILRLTGGLDSDPKWSPDGERIVYLSSDGDGGGKITVINRDGAGAVEIAEVTGDAPEYDWAPDSDRLAFVNSAEIYTVGADGEDLKQLTVNTSIEKGPRWSDDGSEILFSSDTSGDFDLFVMDANGEKQRRLTQSSASEQQADW